MCGMFVAGTGKPRHNHKFQGGGEFHGGGNI